MVRLGLFTALFQHYFQIRFTLNALCAYAFDFQIKRHRTFQQWFEKKNVIFLKFPVRIKRKYYQIYRRSMGNGYKLHINFQMKIVYGIVENIVTKIVKRFYCNGWKNNINFTQNPRKLSPVFVVKKKKRTLYTFLWHYIVCFHK